FGIVCTLSPCMFTFPIHYFVHNPNTGVNIHLNGNMKVNDTTRPTLRQNTIHDSNLSSVGTSFIIVSRLLQNL
ncbi:MAG: hypothetical protein ACKVJK_20410, partial [Methylophagaceae bacterium]